MEDSELIAAATSSVVMKGQQAAGDFSRQMRVDNAVRGQLLMPKFVCLLNICHGLIYKECQARPSIHPSIFVY